MCEHNHLRESGTMDSVCDEWMKGGQGVLPLPSINLLRNIGTWTQKACSNESSTHLGQNFVTVENIAGYLGLEIMIKFSKKEQHILVIILTYF
jgi:hypothetical protein